MTILVTICLTCFVLLAVGTVVVYFEPANQPSVFPQVVMWLTVATMVITLISLITISFYTGDIQEWWVTGWSRM